MINCFALVSFFFNLAWSLYLNITSGKNNHWYFLAILIAIYLVLDFAGLDKISSVLPLVIAILFGITGNGFFLQEIVRKYNSGHRGIIPKSIFNIFIVYAIFIIYAVISTTFFVAQF